MISRKYVKDYRMDIATDCKGKVREKMVYVGPLYEWGISEGILSRLKIQLLVGSIVEWLLFVASLWLYSGMSRIWYVVVPYCCLVFPLFYISTVSYNILTASSPFNRERKEKTVGRLTICCIAGAVLSGGSAAGQIISCILGTVAVAGADVFLMVATWVIFALLLYGFKVSKRLAVREIDNPSSADWKTEG